MQNMTANQYFQVVIGNESNIGAEETFQDNWFLQQLFDFARDGCEVVTWNEEGVPLFRREDLDWAWGRVKNLARDVG